VGVEVWLHAFLNLALDGGEWSASHPSHSTPRERTPSIHWIRGWVGSGASLDAVARKRIQKDSKLQINIGLGAFAASELDKVFSGYQPR
jgi:hypothetical protein